MGHSQSAGAGGTVYTGLIDATQSAPEAIALLGPENLPATYEDVSQQVRRVAGSLTSLGINVGDKVATVVPDSPEMATLFLGCASVATCAPLNPRYRSSDFEFYLSDLKPKLVVVDSDLDSPARDIAKSLRLRMVELRRISGAKAGYFDLESADSTAEIRLAEAHDIALVLHTSGTTSRPKMVPISHSNLVASAANISHSLALTSADRCLNTMPLFHIHGLVGAVLSSLSAGGSVICMPGFQARQFFEWMKDLHPTWYSSVPTMHQAILARAEENEEVIRGNRLRFIRSCSSALSPSVMAELEKTFGVPVIEAYGMTEASHQMASNPLPPRVRKPGSVGVATGTELGIMDGAGHLLPSMQTGEIVVRGPSVTLGYEGNPEANRKSFVDGWFRTGDQGYMDSDGYLFLTGRIKELINRGGEKISPREIDDLLLSHPAVAQALAFAIPDEKLGEDVGAAVVLKPGESVTELEIREYLAGLTADFKVPRRIVFLDKLPTGATGKPQRIGLAGVLGLDNQAVDRGSAEFVAPRNETEAALAELWSDVLGRKQSSVNENFFEVGGDSILAAQLIGRIRRRFGVEVSMPRLFELPTICALSEWLGEHQSNSHLPTMVRVDRSGDIPLSFPQRRMWFASQYAGDSPVYNRAFAIRLRGPLDVFRIQQSLTAVVDRHESLRTNYKLRDGVPVQTIGNFRPVAISIVDLQRHSEEHRIAAAVDWARGEVRKPFALASDLMLRAGLSKLGPEDHVLLCVTHHIAFDATSQAPFLNDLAEAYRGITKELPGLDYPDYASWQVTRGSEHFDEMLEWWKQELRGIPSVHRFPTDFNRPSRQSYRGGNVGLVLDSETSAKVSVIANELGATPFMVLLAAFSALTSRYCDSNECVVGTPTSGRLTAESEEMVGLFVNLVVLRTGVETGCNFKELVTNVRTTTLRALDHQDFPFEKLVEGMAPERSLAHSPLFQIMFEYRNHPSAELRIEGIAAEPFEFESGYSQYDLHFDIRPGKSGMRFLLHYNQDLFRRESAERILSDFRTILSGAVKNPAMKIEELECVGVGARQASVKTTPQAVEENGPAERGIPRQKRSPGEASKLSFAQERLWFLHQLEPDNATYNIPVWLKLTGDIDEDALRKSFEFVLDRHESLRTVFRSRDGAPVQMVLPVERFEFPIVDAANLSHSELHDVARREILRPFDLANDAMIRAALYRVRPDTHYMLIVVHHIAADGWSMPILQQELSAAYRAYVRGLEPNLPRLPVQYADFAAWQREFLSGKVFEQQLDFWTRQLKGAPNNPLMLTDRPRGARQTYGGERYIVPMSAEFEAELNRFNRKERVTLFMTLLAGLETVLHRRTGQTDIVVGAPIANRTRVDLEPLIGFFVNTLALRCDFSDDPTFREVLNRIREKTLEAYQNQDLPFEKLVQALQPERSLSHTPVFQVILAVQNTPDENTDFGALSVVQEDIDERLAKFDMSISVEFKPRLRIVYNVNTDLFEHETVVRFAEHFENFVRAAMASPDVRVSQLEMISTVEREQLLRWGQNSRPYPDKAVHEIFEAVVERSPDSIAIVAGDRQYCYRELDERANQLARALHAVGIGPGKRVGLLMRRSFETIASMLSVLKLGAAYVPLDKDYPRQRIEFISRDCELAAVLTTPDMIDRVPADRRIVRADETESNSKEALDIRVGPDEAAYVIYTSGSTGQPKGVEVPHRGIVRLVFDQEYAQFGPSETTLQLAPLSFDASTLEIWAALLHGGTCVLFSGSRIDAEQVGATVKAHGVSTLWLTSSLFNIIIDESLEALAPVRQLLAGGEALSVPHVRKAFKTLKQTQLINGYGPTENTTFSCCHRISAETLKTRSSIPIGKPIANTDALILNGRMEMVPIGVPGELYLGGDGLAIGYVNRPELTAQKFVSVNLGGRTRRLYRTGDICRWLNDGTIEFLGRSDDQVKIRGFRIELGEIETAIAGNEGVNSVAVVVIGEGANKRLVAYVVAKNGREVTGPKLREYLRESLPDYMIPAQYVFLSELPISKNGKIDKAALPEPSGQLVKDAIAAPHDAVEAKLKPIWENVLGIAPIGVDQDFFELGGHSLLATKLLARIERMFGVKLPIASIFQYSTIEELAPLVRNQSALAKPGGASQPPLLWVGGGTFLRPIAKWLQPDRALISVSLEPEEWAALKPPFRLEAVAAVLAGRILKNHPTGPYHLAGWCYEGLLAYETAQQLRAQGADVGLLVLVDAATPSSRKSFSKVGEVVARIQRETFHLSRLVRRSPSKWPAYLRERFQEFSKRLTRNKWQSAYENEARSESSGGEEGNRILHLSIVDHVLKPYDGPLLFFQAAERPVGKYWDLAWEWKDLTEGRCDCREIPGDHVTLLKPPNIDLLAEHLKTALDAASDSTSRKRRTTDVTYA
jgi:aspartate racemase